MPAYNAYGWQVSIVESQVVSIVESGMATQVGGLDNVWISYKELTFLKSPLSQ